VRCDFREADTVTNPSEKIRDIVTAIENGAEAHRVAADVVRAETNESLVSGFVLATFNKDRSMNWSSSCTTEQFLRLIHSMVVEVTGSQEFARQIADKVTNNVLPWNDDDIN